MAWIVRNLWLIPCLPAAAAALIAIAPQRQRRFAAMAAIGSLGASLVLALAALAHAISQPGLEFVNFTWLQFGTESLKFGWLLDPLTAVMLAMVTFVGLLIFIFSVGYMAHDENFTRFFCFLSLFAGAMLGVVIANNLLLLFMCWEIVGLTSYLLIGFSYERPSAAAAAKKAFIVTRIGDLGFFLGMMWLYHLSGTLLFYDNGAGCLEHSAVAGMMARSAAFGLTAASGVGLLIFCGAVGKSGQVPLHVWLPDAMEGPTPVSALIHAATMVAAGVFLVARVYPLMAASSGGPSSALKVVAWVGAITALFAACIAVAQNDIKRILAYSTVSQLGYMMAGLGLGGVAVGMFHLITHAFFKALLFMGAGSVIHGCHEEQDIRHMGALRGPMRTTFLTYSAGMLALCGFPLLSGFWSKDGILGAAHGWLEGSGYWYVRVPYFLLVLGALLTAFYMTRQMSYVFFGNWRGHGHAHESPAVMTVPLAILASFAVTLGAIGTPAWPWFRGFLESRATAGIESEPGLMTLMLTSSVIVLVGLGLGWMIYGNKSPRAEEPDALEKAIPPAWAVLRDKFYVDELYGATVIAFYGWWAKVADWLDRRVWGGIVAGVAWLFRGWAQLNRLIDANWVDGGFDKGCEELSNSGGLLARVQNG